MNIPLRTENKTGKEHVRKMRLPTWKTPLYKPLFPTLPSHVFRFNQWISSVIVLHHFTLCSVELQYILNAK